MAHGYLLVKCVLRPYPPAAFPVNACAPDGKRLFAFFGDAVQVSLPDDGVGGWQDDWVTG